MATIKGVWMFKDLAPFTAPAQTITQAVNYTTADGTARAGMEIKDSGDTYPVLLNFDGWTVAIYNGETEFRWVGPFSNDEAGNRAFKIVDFGKAEQTVSDEFYSYLTQIAVQDVTVADKLTRIAYNERRVYDAGFAAGQINGLPTYEADITFVGSAASISITHNLGTQKFLLIGRVKEHDGTDVNPWRVSQVIVWSPYAFAQNAEYNLASGGTYNPYRAFVENDAVTGSYIRVVSNGGATSTGVATQEVARKKTQLLHACTDNAFTVALNSYLLAGATWHFTVVDVSSIM